MKPFPLPLRHGGGNHKEIMLGEEQVEWLRRYYPATENYRIAKVMGVSVESVRKFARLYGLAKSVEGMAGIRRRQQAKAARTNHRNGCYDRKRGHPVSEATMDGLRRRWKEVREGLRQSPLTIVKERSPERFAESMARRGRQRSEMIRKEKMRMLYGLERKTRLKPVVLSPYTQSQTHHRSSALKRGYLLDYDCSEGTPGRYVIYYDDETRRSEAFERNCIADGFVFKPDE